ncbi:MAG TPA: CGNR zinc finger domain-containing protein [Pseudonocardiaceae bacterium]|jgi:predicted RNA-binding Zn ribbon-like protein|nr:CGNR zinc finger domain-containing protein [Pseudonocardiaceae bacterium]
MAEPTWPASARYGMPQAPGGLGMVQDLLNTLSAGKPRKADLLATVTDAQQWADEVAEQWRVTTGEPTPSVVLDEDGLRELRDYRQALVNAAIDEPPAGQTAILIDAPAALELHSDGVVRLTPRGSGWRYLLSLLLAAEWRAQAEGTRRRLKVCRNPRCRVAFYDRSRNNSGVWHDVRTCGNAANLRAHRERQRADLSS